MAASKTWRRLNGETQLPKVIEGVKFQDGIEVIETPSQNGAYERITFVGDRQNDGVQASG